MKHSAARNRILKKIRLALAQTTPMPFPQSEGTDSLLQPLQQEVVLEFAEQFTRLQGKFIYCTGMAEFSSSFNRLCHQQQWTRIYCNEKRLRQLIDPQFLHDDISGCEAAVTSCEALVARTGSILLSSVQQGRIPSVYAPVHICIATTSQMVYDISDALAMIQRKYRDEMPSMITLASGPSRTADIEKTLVVGVHGPKEVFCLLVEDHPSR